MFFGGEYWWANLVYLGLECLLAGGTERVSMLNLGPPCLMFASERLGGSDCSSYG
jgi:hypothetical protein